MITPQAPGSRPLTGRSGFHRLLPAAGIAVVVIALLAHFAGGAALLHLGLGGNLGGSTLVVGLAAVISLKLLVVFAARRRWRHHGSSAASHTESG